MPKPTKKPSKRKNGRPTNFSQDTADKICELIEDNKTIREIEKFPGLPAMTTVFTWLRKHDAFAAQYAQARIVQADAIYNDIIQIEQDLASKKIDSNTARVLIDSHKWRAGKMKPSVYGEKQQVEVNILTLEDKLRQIRDVKSDQKALPEP